MDIADARTVRLCGSFRFAAEMEAARRRLCKRGVECLMPSRDEDVARGVQGCFTRIDAADAVLVVDPGGYIGTSVLLDMGYARARGKPTYLTHPHDDPAVMSLVAGVVDLEGEREDMPMQASGSAHVNLSLPRPRAVLFDLDDTLVASSEASQIAWRTAAERLAAACGLADVELMDLVLLDERRREGAGPATEIMGRACARLDVPLPSGADQIAAALPGDRLEAVAPLPDALETLAYLRSRVEKLALVTSGGGPTQRARAERCGLTGFFDAIFASRDVGAEKSDPALWQRVLADMQLEPADAWMVGDGIEYDVRVPGQLGLTTVWMVWPAAKFREICLPREDMPAGSDFAPNLIIRRLSELRRWL